VLEPESDRPAALTYGQFVAVLADAARSLACPDFGMRLALGQAGTDLYGPLGTIMRHSRTLGEALDYVTGHADVHSAAARISRYVIPETGGVVFSHEIIVGAFAQQKQAMEYILLAGHLGARALTGGAARARQVLLRHRPVSPLSVYRRYFGCKVVFDQMLDGLVFNDRDLASAVLGQDPAIHADLIASLSQRFPANDPPIHAAARNAVLRLMHVAAASNAQVAAELGLHTRTLHRRLLEAGTSYQKIKDEVRCELALYYLAQTDVSFIWIANKLNFAEQAVFTRFCRRTFGLSPSSLRAQVRESSAAA
jgi:AraC-like DNA-binding protein